MSFSKLQKTLAIILLFFYFFNISISIPLLNFKVFAKDYNFYDLVSIIVDEDTFSEIQGELSTYAKDISSSLENTKVIILPVPKDTSVFNIASMNESLYFEGYKGFKDVSFNSKLVGTIFVGDIKLPTVFNNGESKRTVLPYTDFENKSYIYNKETKEYEKNESNLSDLKPEIWHSFISPNTGDFSENIESLKIFFEKDHDYYEGKGKYVQDSSIINGNLGDNLKNSYKPYVFYFDRFRELEGFNSDLYDMYESYQDNKEDIIYNRYSSDLAEEMKDNSIGSMQGSIIDLISKVNPNLDIDSLTESDDSLSEVTDVQSKYIINNSTKTFIESFSEGIIGEFRANVNNAGRYSNNSSVNVDLIPYLITIIDVANDEITKELSDSLENQTDSVIADSEKAEDLVIPEKYIVASNGTQSLYENYIFGRKVSTMETAMDCNIVLGDNEDGGQAVEANRGYNVYNMQEDEEKLEELGDDCLEGIESGESLKGLWGKNTPLYLDSDGGTDFKGETSYDGAIVPIFDVQGSKAFDNDGTEIPDGLTEVSSIDACLNYNLILAKRTSKGKIKFSLPEYGGEGWDCFTDNASSDKTMYLPPYDILKDTIKNIKECTNKKLYIDDKLVSESTGEGYNQYYARNGEQTEEDYNGLCDIEDIKEEKYYYKTISSLIEFKSPTPDEITGESASKVTPSLGIVSNRYASFKDEDLNKIVEFDYPNLFRLKVEGGGSATIEAVEKGLDEYLDEKSSEINNLTGENFDYKSFLQNYKSENVEVNGFQKDLNYYDMIVFAIFWNNADVSTKYSFVFENYLSGDYLDNGYLLPKSKKAYEIAYLGASGKSDAMYVGFDPEIKEINPYSEIIAENQNLASGVFSSNVGLDSDLDYDDEYEYDDSVFECGPPDGVPLQEWMPAITCRLGNMLPPTINISSNNCSSSYIGDFFENDDTSESTNISDGSTISESDENSEEEECIDSDKDGLNDCLSEISKIEISSDSSKYGLNSNISLDAELKGNSGESLNVSSLDLTFNVVKVEKKIDENSDFSTSNIETIFDIDDITKDDFNLYKDYLNFSSVSTKFSEGKANYGFSSKGEELNVYLKANSDLEDTSGEVYSNLESNILKIEVRKNKLYLTSFKLEDGEETTLEDFVKVSGNENLFLFDSYNVDKDSIIEEIKNSSSAEEKLVLSITNLSEQGDSTSLSYPLNIKLFLEDDLIQDLDVSSKKDFIKLNPIIKSGEYQLEITDSKGFSVDKTISFLPQTPYSLDVIFGSNKLLVDEGTTTSAITLYDKFGNVSIGDFYKLNLTISGDSLVFVNSLTNTLTQTISEGYSVFRMKSTGNTGNDKLKIQILDDTGKTIIETEKEIQVLDDIDFEIVDKEFQKFEVGNNTYKLKLKFKDSKGQYLTDFSSRVYFGDGSNYLEPTSPYFEINNGEAEIEFQTKTLAGKDIPIEIQIEGINSIKYDTLTILPDLPVKIDLVNNNPKIEADIDSFSVITAKLKDRYDNLVFSDSSTKLNLEIDGNSENILKFNKIEQQDNSQTVMLIDDFQDTLSTSEKTINTKTISFNNGVANFNLYATENPGIGYFKVSTNPSLSNNSFEVSDSSGKITISGVGENSGEVQTLYFWNKDNLEDMNYNALYTTLLGSNYGDITQKDYLAGALIFDENSRALAVTSTIDTPYKQSSSFEIQKSGNIKDLVSSLDVSQNIEYNLAFENNKFVVNLYNEFLNHSIGKVYYNFSKNMQLSVCEEDCNIAENSVFGKSLDASYNFSTFGDNLYFKDLEGNTYFSIDKSGNIERMNLINLELDTNNEEDFLKINIKYGTLTIGYFGIKLKDAELISGSNISENSVGDNSIIFDLENDYYSYIDSGDGILEKISVYYEDPFSSETDLDSFSKSNLYGYENFVEEEGLGWADGNKTLLSFAAGENVGNSVKKSISFGVINIGDPVISLKKIKKGFTGSSSYKQFDTTIGKIITNDEDVEKYELFDYNGDSRDDILLLKTDNYLSLFENKNVDSQFIDMGNLLYLDDMGESDLLKTGDFTGDDFGDIFFVSKNGTPYILNNVEKNFERLDLENQFSLNGNIMRAEVFDMDADGKDDIIILDDNGEINIFYGGGTSENPIFTKKNVSKKYGLDLSSKPRADNSSVYFDGLYQISDLEDSNTTSDSDTTELDKSTVENMIFENLAYSVQEEDDGYLTLDDVEKMDFENLEDTQNYKTFIKGEYASGVGLKVDKVFTDLNGGNLKSGDEVEVDITLKNNTKNKLENIIYLEKLEDYFTLNSKIIESNYKELDIKSPLGTYSFMVDGISLNSGESITLKYNVITSSIKYSYLKVGLFESGEDGDDIYGDIVVQDSYENCGGNTDLFRSVDKKEYEYGVKTTDCERPNSSTDTDSNGFNDDIDAILNGSTEDYQNYAEEQLENLEQDSDGDGKSDDEDIFSSSNGNITVDLSHITDGLEDGLEDVEDIMNGLSCGFSNGGCIATPLNRAPLAPGNDPVFMGKPIGDGFHIDEGIPVFSAQTECTFVRTWPPCPSGAGGRLGIDNPSNTFRFFISPTLTGGVGTAICFGGTARKAGSTPYLGISPLFPGGNCIVMAKPLLGCSDDGSDGEPDSMGFVEYVGGIGGDGNNGQTGGFGYINGNCSTSETTETAETSLSSDYVNEVLGGGDSSTSFENNFSKSNVEGAVVDHSVYDGTPLVSIGGYAGREVNITASDLSDVDFSDITKMTEKRVSAFPSFLMDWMTAQIEEIINKLTDFPTITIILPDFSGLINSDSSWNDVRNNWLEKSGNSGRLEGDAFSSDESFSSYDKTSFLKSGSQSLNSGIKEAYELLASIPLVKVEEQPIYINLPWLGKQDLERAKASRTATIVSRREEIKKFREYDFDTNLMEEIESEVNTAISAVQRNLEIIEDYANIPKHIQELLKKKEEYLEQILCNVNSILDMVGGRIGENGERFKAWVEMYILLKSILKSWQVVLDIFNGYEAECSQCKNERRDTLDWEFSLISMIIPDIPVVQFPKWPDINIDLHNIRAGVTVTLPQFEINAESMVLPELPSLSLPKKLDINFNLEIPKIPILPELVIPELPDIPSLPTVDLPNLPPPPKLPKIFAGFEFITDIVKLVTKAMCILKMSPFVPEWRAGDQIAFLTERNGYLSFDFLNLSLPQFSFPWVDSIDVTTYVNLEYDTDFIIEMARQIANPINNFTGDFTNVLNLKIKDIDLEQFVPSQIDVDVDLESEDKNINIKSDNSTGIKLDEKIGFNLNETVAELVAKNIFIAKKYLVENKDKTISNTEFKKKVSESLASIRLVDEPKFAEVRNIWKEVNNYSFDKENELIADLQKENKDKFEALKDIINTEIIKTKKQRKDIDQMFNNDVIKVSLSETQDYNKYLDEYNLKSLERIYNVVSKDSGENAIEKELKDSGEKLISNVEKSLSSYTKERTSKTLAYNSTGNNLIAANFDISQNTDTTNTLETTESSSCVSDESKTSYVYEGIYIIEDGKSYSLTNYTDELEGDEEIKTTDIDLDGDEDMFYFSNNVLYLKENLSEKPNKTYLGDEVYIISTSENKFLDNSNFIQSVNNMKETVSSSLVNISFSGLKDIYNYRFSYYNIIDKYFREDEEEDILSKKKNVVDGIAGIDDVNLIEEKEDFTYRKSLAWIENIGNFKDIDVYTDEVEGIKQNILDGNVVFVSSKTQIFSGNNPFKFKYISENTDEIQEYEMAKNTSIELNSSIKIIEISFGDGYIKTGKKKHYIGQEILFIKGLPIFPETFIKYDGFSENLVTNSYLEIEYYDGAIFSLDFNDIYTYELYDLGDTSDDYLFSLDRDIDFYYGIIKAFKSDLIGNSSKNVLSSPQLTSDGIPPKIDLNTISMPVYQKKIIDITDKVFEDSGNETIEDLYIDFDLEDDSDGDGDSKDDRDSDTMDNLSIYEEDSKIFISLGKFDELISKDIGIFIVDGNGNIGYKDVSLDVYAPDVEITDFSDNTIYGNVGEDLSGEPVNIYRYRGGGLTKVLTKSDETKVSSDENGDYAFEISSGKNIVNLKDSGEKIAEINENTGKITFLTIKEPFYKVKADLESDSYPKLTIENNKGEKIFYEQFRLKDIKKVNLVEDYSEINEKGLYVKLLDKLNYNFYSLPENISYNPGSLVLYRMNDSSKNPLIIIFKDGRIDFNELFYDLSYTSYEDYVSLNISNSSGKIIANIVYYINGDYILK